MRPSRKPLRSPLAAGGQRTVWIPCEVQWLRAARDRFVFTIMFFGGTTFNNKIKTDLQTARQNFFAGVIKDAMISGPLAGLAELPDGTNPRNATNEKLWTTKIPVRKNGKVVNVDLINLKDTGNFDDPALLNASEISNTDANAMRDFVNRKLGKVGNEPNSLYKQFLAVIKSEQDL